MSRGMRIRVGAGLFALSMLTFISNFVAAEETVRRHVVIVANNTSLDDGVAPLRFADDDGARYYELFKASGADTHLLAVLDEDAQVKFADAAAAARLPKMAALRATLASVFAAMRAENAAGHTTHFTFVYAGHGNVGPNREGYIHLLDARLHRRGFYKEVIAASPATFNHIILDACHAYYLVNKRGDTVGHRRGDFSAEIRDFLSAELLSSYPNTGVILAASKDSETHEWERLESGIFSHELLSALQGAADVDEDGRITYPEAAACVAAANVGVKMPKARLNVYFKAPSNRRDLPLIDLAAFAETPTLRLSKEMEGRYSIEDSRGIRTADLHFSGEQAVRLRLVGEAPFYIRTETEEAEIPAVGVTESAALSFHPFGEHHRGSLDESFRKHLFEIPFGLGFYRGMYAVSKRTAVEASRRTAVVDATPPPKKTGDHGGGNGDAAARRASVGRLIGWSALGGGIGAGIASGVLYGAANASHDAYDDADDIKSVRDKRDEANRRLELSRLFMGLGIGMAAVGATVVIVDAVLSPRKRSDAKKRGGKHLAPKVVVAPGPGLVGVSARF